MSHSSAESLPKAWSEPEPGEQHAPKKKHRNRRGGRHYKSGGEHIHAEANPTGVHEYSARDLETALIWARDPKEAKHALIQPRETTTETVEPEPITAPVRTEVKQPPVMEPPAEPAAIETKTADEHAEPDTSWVEDFAATPFTETTPATPLEPAREHEWATLDHTPADVSQRAYFWNTAEVLPGQDDHEALPAITNENEQAGPTQEPERPQVNELPSQPSLDQAINPNTAPAFSPTSISTQGPAESIAEPISRHLETTALQSQEMTAQNFEQLAAGSTADEATLPNELYVQDELPAQSALETEAGLTSAPTFEAGVWPGFGFGTPASEAVAATAEQPPAAVPSPETGTVEHTLNSSELSTLAESIRVDGVSVQEMFTANRIDEEGLRRIVSAYLRGDELRQTIAQEIVRQQMKFERDPQLRDTPVQFTEPGATKRTANRIKQGTMSLLDAERAKDRTDKIGELTQNALEKSQEFFNETPNVSRYLSIAAIVVIYMAILIVALSH